MPAMHSNSHVNVNFTADSCTLDLLINEADSDSIYVWSEHSPISSDYMAYYDTFFKNGYNQFDSSVVVIHGIIIQGKYTVGEDKFDFIFWSPEKGSDGYLFFEKTLYLLNNTLTTRKSKRYLRILKKYLN
ncbi:MAG: hypothetical protein K9H49_08650 [Bacteroidales bacterium]|nr:hypothetical protein [Bacteroidales bacterium]MCF8389498.1 hypothetical protein [Bacteroidales bacterium]